MKRLLILCLCVFCLSYVSGCRNETAPAKPVTKAQSSFPRPLAGTWKLPDGRWTIVLSPQGTLSSAIISLAGAEIRPNQTTKMEMKDGSISTFTAGDCPVEYDPATRELSVVIYIEKLHIKFMDIANDGYTRDVFAGKVSEDGKSWTPDWLSFFNYGPDLPQDPNDAYLGSLTFEKVGDWKEN